MTTPRPYHDQDFRKSVLWSAHLGPLDGKRGETLEVSIHLDRDARVKSLYCFASAGTDASPLGVSQGARLLSISVDDVVRATFGPGLKLNTHADAALFVLAGGTITARVRFDRKCVWVGEIFGEALPPPTIEEVIQEEVWKYYNP